MIDIRIIRENPDSVKKSIIKRHLGDGSVVDAVVDLDRKSLVLLKDLELKRALRNSLSEAISKTAPDAREKLIAEASVVKSDIKTLEGEYEKVDGELKSLLPKLPNLMADDVPEGKDDSENVVLRKFMEPTKLDFTPKDHIELGELLDIIDIERAGKVSGSRFYYLKNEAALLQFGLIQFCMQTLTNKEIISKLSKEAGSPFDKPFCPVVPPVFIKPEVMKKMDRYDPIEERYYIPSDDLVLVGSAEHTLGPMYLDETLNYDDLPVRYIGYSTAFRREAGSYGKDVRGILRVHQFDKLEMETFVSVEHGESEQRLLVGVQEYLMQQLEIPHQVVIVCSGDMGKPDFKQIDVECWMPGQGKYRETHSSDYMTDYQSRRLNSAYRDANGDRKYLYMNDATAIAIGRTVIAILENYQQADGSVRVPKVLQKYVGTEIIMPRKSVK